MTVDDDKGRCNYLTNGAGNNISCDNGISIRCTRAAFCNFLIFLSSNSEVIRRNDSDGDSDEGEDSSGEDGGENDGERMKHHHEAANSERQHLGRVSADTRSL